MNRFCQCIAEYFLGPRNGAPDPLVHGAPRTFRGQPYSSPVTIDANAVVYPPTFSYTLVPGAELTPVPSIRPAPVPTDLATNQPFGEGERLASQSVRLPRWNTEWIQNYGGQFMENTIKPPLAYPQYSYSEVDVNSLVDRERLRLARDIYGNENLGY
jgi:hypothetical protein